MNKYKIISLIILLLGTGGFFILNVDEKTEVVSGYLVTPTVYEESLSGIGYVQYDLEVTLQSEVIGQVSSVLVEPSSEVTLDDVLITLDDGDARIIYESLEDQLALSEARYSDYLKRYHESVDAADNQSAQLQNQLDELLLTKDNLLEDIKLKSLFVEEGFAPQSELDTLQDNQALLEQQITSLKDQIDRVSTPPLLDAELKQSIEMAQNELKRQEMTLEKYTLKAPLTGTVLEVFAKTGESVQIGAPLLTIASPKKHILLSIDEKYLSNLSPGMPATLSIEAYKDQVFKGTVTDLLPTVNAETGTIDLKISIDEHPERFLKDLSVKVTLDIASFEDALVIDSDLVVFDDAAFVYTADEKGIVSKTEIEIYNKNQDRLMITDGLSANSILLEPTSLEEGNKVQVKRVDMP